MKQMLDLYSGLGGASEAFYLSDKWEVLRIENNLLLSEVPKTRIMSVFDPEIWLILEEMKPEFIWASPPCLGHSLAYSAPKPKAQREGRPYEPPMQYVERAIELIEQAKPKYWAIENVAGAINDFKPLLGKPRIICGPFVIWGNFPLFTPPLALKNHTKKAVDERHSPIRSNIRAKLPLLLSESFLKTIETQHTLF
jgi:site-specific DNA-cytosine methylase